MAEVILEVEGLKQYFEISEELTIKAVDGVSFKIHDGEVFGLVGETGCGKSTIARAVSGIYRPTAGRILYRGLDTSERKVHETMHRECQMIFQDSGAALNPRMTVEKIIQEPLKLNALTGGSDAASDGVQSMLQKVGMDSMYMTKYPTELSGGQRQRVAIARSLIINPKLVIADEPIASLDISIQAQIINLFRELQSASGFSFLFIAHDLSVVRYISNRTGVMLHGRLVELAETEELFENPVHPYTRSLLSAIHVPDPLYERNKVFSEYDTGQPLGEEFVEKSPGHFVLEG